MQNYYPHWVFTNVKRWLGCFDTNSVFTTQSSITSCLPPPSLYKLHSSNWNIICYFHLTFWACGFMPDIKCSNWNRHDSCHQAVIHWKPLKIWVKWLLVMPVSMYLLHTVLWILHSLWWTLVFSSQWTFSAVCFLRLSFLKDSIAYDVIVDILFKKN